VCQSTAAYFSHNRSQVLRRAGVFSEALLLRTEDALAEAKVISYCLVLCDNYRHSELYNGSEIKQVLPEKLATTLNKVRMSGTYQFLYWLEND